MGAAQCLKHIDDEPLKVGPSKQNRMHSSLIIESTIGIPINALPISLDQNK